MTLRPFRQAAAFTAPLLARATRGSARKAIETRLGPLQGASTKVAQLLAARDGRDAGARLRPIPLRRLLARIAPETRQRLDGLFSSIDQFDRNGRRASLGQVHHAITDAGRAVAVKLTLPGVHEDLASDLKTLGWVGRRAARRRTGLDAASIDDWLTALGDELLGELDLPAEADHQRYELVQERLHLWGQPGGAERGDFALQAFVMLAGCKLPSPLGSAAVSGKPGSVWISLDAGSNFDDLAHLQIPVVPARSEIAKVRAAEAKDRTGSTSGLFPHADRQPSVTTSPGLHPALQLC